MKYSTERPYSDLDKAERRLMQHVRAFERCRMGETAIADNQDLREPGVFFGLDRIEDGPPFR
jgi:hypothetical protein